MEGNEGEKVRTTRTKYVDSESELSDEELYPASSNLNTESEQASADTDHKSHKVDRLPEKDESKVEEDHDIEAILLRQSQSHSMSSSSAITKAPVKPVRHDRNNVRPGVQGTMESSALLVDVQKDDSDSEEDIPLSWQRSSRSMRDQLLKDGYNLDLESDNEDLDLIPPKQSYSTGGGICSCSPDACLIS